MKPFNLKDWEMLMSALKKFNVQPLEETYNSQVPVLNIRHDVDDDIHAAVEMAIMEDEFDIRATYFILDTAAYFGRLQTDIHIRDIVCSGHCIGWHNNALSVHLKTGKPLIQCISRPLQLLRENYPVIGTAAHGEPSCREMNFLNFNIFGYDRKGWNGYKGQRFTLDDFGLKYEACNLADNGYISDAGGSWSADIWKTLDLWQKKPGRYQINIHPQYWEL